MNTKLTLVFRLILGLILLIFGMDKFFHFLPMPAMEGGAGEFMGAMISTGYLFKLIGLTEITAGALLVFKKWVGLAMILASVLIVNIVAFHLFLAPYGIGLAALMLILIVLLYYANWNTFKGLF